MQEQGLNGEDGGHRDTSRVNRLLGSGRRVFVLCVRAPWYFTTCLWGLQAERSPVKHT